MYDHSRHRHHIYTQVHKRRKGKENRSATLAVVSDGERQAGVGNWKLPCLQGTREHQLMMTDIRTLMRRKLYNKRLY
ncbi:hypothetical protein F7725_010411 [Dissostichus mawsoni]|uniref:Uncharacterized protein n=1 Tax=Dissostichus mawsoni TaxID=36200 RepID=A0A7J5XP45_DISMA|nr:hypothetical protein F7725_010411 [Dissostichus mawsoni]